eukprot:2062396-Amphidinium_carterae.1
MQYDSSGDWQLTRQRGTLHRELALAVAVSVEGQVYVAGYTGGSLDGQSSAGGYDAFLMQFESSSSTSTSSHSSQTTETSSSPSASTAWSSTSASSQGSTRTTSRPAVSTRTS